MKMAVLLEGEVGVRRIIFNAARRIRRELEKLVVRGGGSRLDADELEGFCGIASARLLKHLQAAGLDAKVIEAPPGSYSHFFIEVEGYLVDITASQFGKPRIVIRRLSSVNPDEDWFWRKHKTHSKFIEP